jgi:Fur family ferric uptake transcriptional regulator
MSEAMGDVLAKLKKAAKRLTPQRRSILEVLLDSHDHLDVEQIRARAARSGEQVSYATVYRTMRMLVDSGLIKERHFDDGTARYEYVKDGEHHDHLICVRCGDVIEFYDDTVEARQEAVAAKHGFTMTGHRHEIYGVCAACAR